jgi:hypothetical protein
VGELGRPRPDAADRRRSLSRGGLSLRRRRSLYPYLLRGRRARANIPGTTSYTPEIPRITLLGNSVNRGTLLR